MDVPRTLTNREAIDAAVTAVGTGELVVLPTDTVYGLCATPYHEEPLRRAYELKGRKESQPVALLAVDVDFLFECVPELRGRAGRLARALLPGALTLILPNPAERFRWLTGDRPDTIGVRVPVLPGPSAAVLRQVGAVMATSANKHGDPDPARLEDVPEEIRSVCAAIVDGGELPGVPSTVLDLTGPEPKVLREGAVPAERALASAAAVPA
ncbi:MAG: L-threonylcarbamoyladenylate synthase [Actinomycetota bacterium]|nr:L-threonylcarbamoyladenylate synthase [Actinomycetota bacterium]